MLPRRADISEVWTQAWPTIVAMLSYTLMQFVDSLMVSVLGPNAVAGQGNGGIWSWVAISCAFGILALVNTLVAQRVGAEQHDEVARYGWAGLWISLGYWLAVLVPFAFVIEHAFRAMGHEPELVALETSYARVLLGGACITLAAKALSNFFFGLQSPKVVTVAAISGNIVNVVANYAFIYGERGLPELGLPGIAGMPSFGVTGAAIGTLVGTAVEACIPLAVFLSRRLNTRYSIRSRWRPDRTAIVDVLRLGWPAGLQFANEMVCWALFMTVLAGGFGNEHMTAGWAAMRFVHISFMPAVGLSTAATSLVGKHIGEQNLDRAARSAHIAVGMAVVWMGACALCFILFRHELTAVFIDADTAADSAARIRAIGAGIFICASIFQLLDAVGIVYTGALRGAGDTLFPGVATVVLSWVVIIGGGMLMTRLAPQLESIGPWLAATAYIVVLGVVLAIRFERGGWRRLHLLNMKDHSGK
ncbi:MAG: MATE family efflux transporter [Limnohabitans sp.]|nr:MATE family efflux transporter [Limnohabitans sp.]